MNLLITILIGFAIGTMVELLLPGHQSMELILAMLLGAAGALSTRYLGEKLGWYGPEEPAGFLAALLGAVFVLIAYGGVFRRGHRSHRS